MPPEGYETVTVPEEVAARLDELVEAGAAENRAGAVKALAFDESLDAEAHTLAARLSEVEDRIASIEDHVDRLPANVRDELQRDLY